MCDSRDFNSRNFVNTFSSECFIDRFAESNIIEESFRILGFVFNCELVIFSFGKVEVQLGKDRVELVLGYMTFPKFIEVDEELFDSHTLHYNERA